MTIPDYLSIAGLLITAFIAYHIHYLSKSLKFSDKMSHRKSIRESVDSIMSQIRRGINSEVELINVNRYLRDYPINNDDSSKGYTYLRVELRGKTFDGVEFFSEMPRELYLNNEGKYTFNKTKRKAGFNAYPVGLIPYEWIEFIDLAGDEYKYVPQLYVNFKGIKKLPFKSVAYYRLSDHYDKGNDPIEFEYSTISSDEFEVTDA